MRLECYEDSDGFDTLRPEWNQLLHQSATDVLFLTWEWQQAWWDAFGQGKDLQLLVLRGEDERPLAIVPLFAQRSLVDPNASLPVINVETPLIPPNAKSLRTVHLVGGSEVSDYLDIIAPGELSHQVCRALLDFLGGKDDWEVLDLRCLPSDSPTVSAATELAQARGWHVQRVREDVCPVLDLPDTWDEYLALKLDKKRRHELRRKMRKAERETDVRWHWVEADGLDEGLATFFELHRASDPGKDEFMSGGMEAFFRKIAQAAWTEGWLRLSVLRFDGRAVASYLCFDYRGDRLVYNSGFDLSAFSQLSPGIVLMGYLIEDAIQAGCKRVDFLQGDERYKYDLGAVDTEVMRVLISRDQRRRAS